ncbi:tyrosine-type recombinase/integrase [Vagococcus fluvialis]|nr:tyrosine-type recombinase/integrase [Vagococcus fluvialis]UDM72659.1 tyrosine-type recombinase/integrase [Vagococcus fluvialis]UDM78382.1 tyrosine-type recombinase/integrase [Vagococcus fluvialis]
MVGRGNKLNIEQAFEIWIDSKRSKATQKSYRRVVPQFFDLMIGKEIKYVSEIDMLTIVPATVEEKYINILIGEGYKQSTIKYYLVIVSSFIEYLSINRVFDVDFTFISEIALKGSSLRDDSGRRELMPEDEYERFKEWLLDRKFAKRYGNLNERYALALEFMYSTAIRINSAFSNVYWNDIVWETDLKGNEGWTVYAVDKGEKLNSKPINSDLYDKLREVFYKDDGEDDLVLNGISKQSFTRLMKEYSEEHGVKMTPHSIRVGAATKVYKITNDIVLTSRFLDHADTKTTERYIRTDDDRTNTGSYIMTTDIDECQLEGLSLEDLNAIINKRSDLKRTILLEANKMKLL